MAAAAAAYVYHAKDRLPDRSQGSTAAVSTFLWDSIITNHACLVTVRHGKWAVFPLPAGSLSRRRLEARAKGTWFRFERSSRSRRLGPGAGWGFLRRPENSRESRVVQQRSRHVRPPIKELLIAVVVVTSANRSAGRPRRAVRAQGLGATLRGCSHSICVCVYTCKPRPVLPQSERECEVVCVQVRVCARYPGIWLM